MASSLPPDLITKLKPIILPYVRDKDEREALLIEAFYLRDPRPLDQLNQGGSAEVFTVRCIADLIKFGCLALQGEQLHALAALLLTVRARCGVDKQQQIDELVPIINAVCGYEKSETVSPTPPMNPIQSVKTPAIERTPTVFISYSHVDKVIAEKLIADLGKSGHACWIDKVEIKGGDEWIQSITEGINNSYAFISLLSEDANRSTWVRREFLWAEYKKKPIYPVQVASCVLPIYVMERQVTKVQSDYASGLQALVASLPTPRIVPLEVDDSRTVKSVLAREQRPVSRRELELAYMDRLRFEEFQIEKYVTLPGNAHLAPKARRTVELFALHPDLMRQEFTHTPWAREGERETRHFEDAVSELLAIRRAVVLGEPGAGKTTTLWRLARALYDVAQQDPAAPIPLLIKLGKWTDEAQPLAAFIAVELGDLGEHLDMLLKEQRAALLLDGLNEIPAAQHKRKFEQVAAFIRRHPKAMAVITCRKQDYTVDLHFDQVEITPLDPLRIREFALRSLGDEDGQRLFWKLAGESARRQETAFREQFAGQRANWERLFWLADALPEGLKWGYENWTWQGWRHERDNPSGLMLLARNPYMLRMLAEVYVDRDGDLPPNRGDLFRSFVERLLIREGIAQRDEHTRQVILSMESAQLLDALAQLAYIMQIQRATNADGNALTVLPLDQVKALLTDHLLYLAVSTSILTSGDEVRFSHQLLQEYFAARYMGGQIQAHRLQAETIWKPERWWERTNWEEAAILLAGLSSDDRTTVLDWLAEANPETAALCIARSGATTPDDTKKALRDRWLPRLTDLKRDVSPLARAAVGRALGLFTIDDLPADHRKGVSVIVRDGVKLPDIDWVSIPGGEFLYQEDQRMTLPAFQMSRYLITYAQFQTFIDAPDGFYHPVWWEGLSADDDHKAQPGDQAFKFWTYPRERVSWYDAVAFTRWLSAKLGYTVTLPTEQQYERAARWTDGREYPYAGKYDPAKANTRDTGIQQTSAVGIFPNGTSKESVHDLSGNVWEWCLNEYRNLERIGLEGSERRVLRGGSWYDGRNNARAAYRGVWDPDDRNGNFGFRLVTSVAPHELGC